MKSHGPVRKREDYRQTIQSKGSAFLLLWPMRSKSAQAFIEYAILLAAIAAVAFIGTAAFFQRVCHSKDGGTSVIKNYFNQTVEHIR